MTPEQISSNYDYSIIVRRWGAFWLDGFFLIALGCVMGLPDKFRAVLMTMWFLLAIVYYPLLEGLTGSSFGKWLCQLKVVNADGGTPGIGKAIIRTLLRLLEVNPLLFGGLPAAIVVATTPTRQRLGDKAANTFVLRCEDLSLIGVPPTMPVQNLAHSLADPFAIPGIPGIGPTPYSRALTPDQSAPSVLTTYPGSIGANTLNPTAIWSLPGAILLSVFAIGITVTAFRLHVVATNARPITMTCSDFVNHPPKDGWYHLTGCEWDVRGSVYFIPGKTDQVGSEYESAPSGIQDVYVPVFPTTGTPTNLTGLVIQSMDRSLRNTVTEIDALKDDDAKGNQKWAREHTEELSIHSDIQGTIQSDTDVPKGIRDKLLSTPDVEVSPGFAVIKEGAAPTEDATIGAGVVAFFTGIGAFIFWILVAVSVCQRSSAPMRR